MLQVATIERAQQEAAASLRAEWQRELEVLKRDIAARKRLMATQASWSRTCDSHCSL